VRAEAAAAPRERLATRLGWTLAVVGLAALGALWLHDRMKPWRAPRWEPARFVALTSARAPDVDVRWVAIVNPLCPHCRAALPQVAALRARTRPPPDLCVLIVDSPRRPDRATVASLRVPEAWWDAANVWRQEWGHRVYGEVLVFDRSGRLIETRPPAAP
jgi:hypothetical protein